MMNMLETKGLSVGYDRRVVVDGLDFEIKKGQVIALLGPNGAGKSTILKSLSALLAPINGAVLINDKNLSDFSRKSLSKVLAVVLTERLNGGFLSAFDIAAMGRYPHTGFMGQLTEKDKKIVWECLKEVNAENLANRIFNELSDGEKQKIMLARALAQEPEMIILDEPTTHLDIRHKLELMNILKRLSREKGMTVIFSLHEIDLAIKSCDLAILVKNGKIVDLGFPEQVGKNNGISSLFEVENAGYHASMGMVELINQEVPSVFVVGGGGTAIETYRMLTQNNIGFYTGVLHENDIDCHVAETIGAVVVKERSFEKIGLDKIQEAKKWMDEVDLVIDTGFPVTEMNEVNRNLIAEFLEAGKCVCSLRNHQEESKFYGKLSQKLILCEEIRGILEHCSNESR